MDATPRVVHVVAVGSATAAVDADAVNRVGDRARRGAVDGVGVVVVGEADAVGAAVAALRRDGGRVAGFVGDVSDPICREAVASMAVELFAADQVSYPPYPGDVPV